MTKSALDIANIMDIIVDHTKSRIPKGGYTSVLSNTWADLKVGVLDPAEWGTSDSWTKPDPGATKQMVRYPGFLFGDNQLIMAQRQAIEEAYAKIKSEAKSFHHNVPLPSAETLKINGELATRILFSKAWQCFRSLQCYLTDSSPFIAGYFKQNLESYLSGLETSQIKTLQGLIEFNSKHADKELPPRMNPKQRFYAHS